MKIIHPVNQYSNSVVLDLKGESLTITISEAGMEFEKWDKNGKSEVQRWLSMEQLLFLIENRHE